jgi:Tol biopolymer transport system component
MDTGVEDVLRTESIFVVFFAGFLSLFCASPLLMQSSNYEKIAFISDRDEYVGYQIYGMNPDGSNQVRLSSSFFTHSDPAWSPDGEKIAFTSRSGNSSAQICVMDADGSNVINLSLSSSINGWPGWSPDGKKIAFFARKDEIGGLFVMDADGSNVVNLTDRNFMDRSPSWSPDGKKIAFTPGNSVYIINADGSNLRKLINDVTDPAWSPDGKRIAVTMKKDENWEIYVMDIDGSNLIQLTDNSAWDCDPEWSPDGEKIAFTSNRDGNDEIYVMNADGSNQVNVTNNPAEDRYPSWCCHSLRESSPAIQYLPAILFIICVLVISLAIIFLRRKSTSQ